MAKGWHFQSYRHSLAAKGISTSLNKSSFMVKTYPENMAVPSDIKQLAHILGNSGATGVYAVGGYVRDKLIGAEPKDLDIEVHGKTSAEIKAILEANGYVVTEEVGKSFGVLKVKVGDGYVDVAVPRTDSTGRKPEVTFLENATPEEAARRRDITVNAIMYDILNDEIVDPYGGVSDLGLDRIRAVSKDTFSDDPLRTLRVARFASSLGFEIEPGTVELAKGIDASKMSGERIRGELENALLRSEKPSVFFSRLDELGQLEKVFPEIARLKGVKQDPIWHPEGDAYQHTMEVLDRAKANGADMDVLLTALLHDTGKFTRSAVSDSGRIKAIEHEADSAKFASDVLGRLKYNKDTEKDVVKLTEFHMSPKHAARDKRSDLKIINRLLVDFSGGPSQLMARPEYHLARFRKLLDFQKYDTPGQEAEFDAIRNALPPDSHYKSRVDVPKLIEAGYKGPELGEAISSRYRQQINEVFD